MINGYACNVFFNIFLFIFIFYVYYSIYKNFILQKLMTKFLKYIFEYILQAFFTEKNCKKWYIYILCCLINEKHNKVHNKHIKPKIRLCKVCMPGK